jgi:hypothetical protein
VIEQHLVRGACGTRGAAKSRPGRWRRGRR